MNTQQTQLSQLLQSLLAAYAGGNSGVSPT